MSSSPVVGTREVAYRVFAAEFDDASLSYSESDEERAPNYVVTPTGARLNRTFVAGALTEVEHVNDEVLRGRIADPTGAFVTYAGQYQPDPMAFLEQATPPAFVALAGKARTYEPDDADVVYTSIRPESINTVDADVRDRWLVSTAEATLERIAVFDEALAMPQRGDELRRHLEARGVDSTLAAGIPRAIDHYGTTRAYLEAVRTVAVQALELVAGERDQVENLTVAPDDDGDVTLGSLPELDLHPADSVDVSSATDDEMAADESGEPEVAAVEGDADTPAADTDDEPDADADAAAEPLTTDATTAETADSASPSSTVDSSADDSDAETVTVESSAAEPETTPTENESSTAVAETETAETGVSETEPSQPDSEPAPSSADSSPETSTTDADSTTGSTTADSLDEPELDELGDFEDDLPDIESADESDESVNETADPSIEADASETTAAEESAAATDETATDAADPSGMYEMDDEERAEIESEFGTEFTSGSDVDPAGEADIDVPDVDELSEQADPEVGDADTTPVADDPATADAPSATDTDTEPESEPEPAVEADADSASETDDAPVEDVDLESAVVQAMEEIDDGDGAAHDDVLAAVVDEYGADPDAVEDAIQDALLGGRCYEPQDDVLKAV